MTEYVYLFISLMLGLAVGQLLHHIGFRRGLRRGFNGRNMPSCARCSEPRVTTLCLACSTALTSPDVPELKDMNPSFAENLLAEHARLSRKLEADHAARKAETAEAKTLYCPGCARPLAFFCPTCVKSHFSGKCTTCFDAKVVRESQDPQEKALGSVTRTRPCPTCCPAPKPLGPQPTP